MRLDELRKPLNLLIWFYDVRWAEVWGVRRGMWVAERVRGSDGTLRRIYVLIHRVQSSKGRGRIAV